MEYQFKITKDLDRRVNDIVYAYINQWEDDSLLTDIDLSVFLMYIENKLHNLRAGKPIDEVTDRRLKGARRKK